MQWSIWWYPGREEPIYYFFVCTQKNALAICKLYMCPVFYETLGIELLFIKALLKIIQKGKF